MRFEQLMPFLADPTENDAFDDLLEQLRFKGRPKGPDLTNFIRTPDKKVTATFHADVSFNKYFPDTPHKSEGSYLLSGIGSEPGGAELPYGLDWTMDFEKIRGVIGEPKEVDPTVVTFVRDGLMLTVRFKDEKRNQLTSATLSLIDVYTKKRFGI